MAKNIVGEVCVLIDGEFVPLVHRQAKCDDGGGVIILGVVVNAESDISSVGRSSVGINDLDSDYPCGRIVAGNVDRGVAA